MLPRDLLVCEKHLTGPEFLHQDDSQWPVMEPAEVKVPMENLPELKTSVQLMLHTHEKEDPWLERFSSISRMQRVFAYCMRFSDRLRKRSTPTGLISHAEHDRVLRRVIKYTQQRHFPHTFKQIQ